MQKKAFLLIIALLLLLAPAAALAEEENVSSTDLIERAKEYDGQSVVYEGEVIGDILLRGDYAWLNVSDGVNTIGCWVSAAQTDPISVCGGYGKRGDTVRVSGVFHRACAEHGGDLDIHADSLLIVRAGAPAVQTYPKSLLIAACALPLPAAALLILVWKRKS